MRIKVFAIAKAGASMGKDFGRPRHCLFLPTLQEFQEAHWRPHADVYRTAEGWLVKFELAGVRPEEITVEVSARMLKVRGCRRDWLTREGHSHYTLEIAYSCFERTVELPFDVEHAQVRTEYREGMLLVWIRTENDQ